MKNMIKSSVVAVFMAATVVATNAKFYMELDLNSEHFGEKCFDTLKLSPLALPEGQKAEFLNAVRILFPFEKYALETEQAGPNTVMRSELYVSTYTGIMSVYGDPGTQKFGASFFDEVPSDADMAFDANIKTDILMQDILQAEKSLGFSVIERLLVKTLNTSTITVEEIIRKSSGRLQFAISLPEKAFFIRITPDEKPDPGLSDLLRTEFAGAGLRDILFVAQTGSSVTICNDMEWWNKSEKRISDTEKFKSLSGPFPEKAHGWMWTGSLDDEVAKMDHPEKFKEVVDIWATTAPIFGAFTLEDEKVSSVSVTKADGFSEVIGRQILDYFVSSRSR